MSEFLREVEGKYDVAKVLVERKQAWPILRVPFAMAHVRELIGVDVEPKRDRLTKGLSSLHGLLNWAGSYEYLAYTNSRESSFKIVDGKRFDRLVDPIITLIGTGRVLDIETPSPHHSSNGIAGKRVVSSHFPNTLATIREMLSLRKPRLENEGIIKRILDDYGLKVGYRRILTRFEYRYRVNRWLLGRYNPKALFVVTYYDDIARVKAARDLGISVVEIQHGSIGRGHEAYNVHTPLDRNYFPSHILVFGERDREIFGNGLFVDPSNVHPVGSFYVDYMKGRSERDGELVKLLSSYRLRVAVTLQSTIDDELVSFVRECAVRDLAVAYILIPRPPKELDLDLSRMPPNVLLFGGREFYELMGYVDVHATVYSGCAVEAPSFGVSNVLVNLHGLSWMYLGDLLDAFTTRYVQTPEEFLAAVNELSQADRRAVMRGNEGLIKPNYKENLARFCGEVLGESNTH